MYNNLLITGGAGFIGSCIAKECIKLGYNVTIIDNLSTGFVDNIPEGAEFIEMDISDPKEYKKLDEKKFDAVMHLAGQSSGEISYESPSNDCRTNTLGTLVLLDYCVAQKIHRFLYASSMSVYGDITTKPVSEKSNPQPLSFYGISKLSSERYLMNYASKGIDATAFRMFSVYGPGQNMDNLKQGMVSIYMAYLLRKEPILVKGSKSRFRDFIYISDVVSAWINALENKNSFGKIYNLGTGVKTTVETLLNSEIKAFNEREDYPIVFEGSTPNDQFGVYADISLIKSDLQWSPHVSLNEGLSEMVNWLCK